MNLPHATTRLSITYDPYGPRTAHINAGCAHTLVDYPLCENTPGPTTAIPATDADPWRVCQHCADVANDDYAGFIPRGPEHLITAFTYPPATRAFQELRDDLQALPSLHDSTMPAVGTMRAATDATGQLHLDPWCASYPSHDQHLVDVRMDPDGRPDFGAPIHCRRTLPTHIEDALVDAAHIAADRDHLISLGQQSPTTIHAATTRLRRGEGDEAADGFLDRVITKTSSITPDSPLMLEQELNRRAWTWVDTAVPDGWSDTDEATAEAAKILAWRMFQDPSIDTGFDAVETFTVECPGFPPMGFIPAQMRMSPSGRHLTLGETREIIDAVVASMPSLAALATPEAAPTTAPEWVNEDIYDCFVTQEDTVDRYATSMAAPCLGRIVVVPDTDLLPSMWRAWPHTQTGEDNSLTVCWVPDLLPLTPATAPVTDLARDLTAAAARAKISDFS